MVHICKERFSIGTYHKLQARKIGSLIIMASYGDNVYSVELPWIYKSFIDSML